MRELTYGEAIQDALDQAMELSEDVFVMGEGVDDDGGIFGSTKGLAERFGSDRCFDLPLAENAFTGAAVGAAIAGMRPVVVHQRLDFLLLTMDPLVNHAAKWRYMFDGVAGNVPVTVRAIVGKGWGQAAQHSQSLQAMFAQVPGLRVAMPATPFDVKGLLLSSIFGEDPVVFIEARSIYNATGPVPEQPYLVPFGKARIARRGEDITLVANSYLVSEAIRAAESLSDSGVSAEVIDMRTISPWDERTILESVSKTGRLVVLDTASQSFGVSAEIATTIYQKAFGLLKSPIERVTLPDTPTPCASNLEQLYYPTAETVCQAAQRALAA